MTAISIQEAQQALPELIRNLHPGEEIVLTSQGQPVAAVKKLERESWPCKAGSAAGQVKMADDFDAPLEDFKEYME